MSNELDLSLELGVQFTIESKHDQLELGVGIKSSSLFQSGTDNDTSVLGITVLSAEALGLFRAVTVNGFYCQASDLDSLGAYAGVTEVAVAISTPVKVTRSGLISEGSWSWTPNAPIFVGSNGVLTQTPTALPLRRIGWATAATQINLDPYPIIGA